MESEGDRWYRTGAVAKALGSSQHRIRELARAGLIESQLRNGYRYIPGREVERPQREGLPPMPANADLDAGDSHGAGAQPGAQQDDPPARPARSRLTQELYAEPSRQLAKSKEKLIRLEHSLEAKRLQQQSREIDRAAREEQARVREAQRVQDWRNGYITHAVERVPADLCADVCARIDDLLNRVPPCTNVAAKAEQIIEATLQPLRRRAEQARALEAHRKRIVGAARMISLPYGARSDECEEARELAATACAESLPVGASDRQLLAVFATAIRPVVERINLRRADEERRQQEANHKYRIDQHVSLVTFEFFSDATSDECSQAKLQVRNALEQLPVTATSGDLDAVKNRALAPLRDTIRQRKEAQRQKEQERHQKEIAERAEFRQKLAAQQRAESLLAHVETHLKKLEGMRQRNYRLT